MLLRKRLVNCGVKSLLACFNTLIVGCVDTKRGEDSLMVKGVTHKVY